jgi:hypothetical protein
VASQTNQRPFSCSAYRPISQLERYVNPFRTVSEVMISEVRDRHLQVASWCAQGAHAQGKERTMPSNPLIGTWRLVSCENRSADGQISYPLGKDGVGCIIYNPYGYIFVALSWVLTA